MPTSRPFAYNPGATVNGTEQLGLISIGWPDSGFASTGLTSWNGPDEDPGYIIAKRNPLNNQPTPVGITASIGFSRSTAKTDPSFIDLSNSIHGATSFISATAAKTWLNSNGFWTSYNTIVTNGLVLSLDASIDGSYPGSGSTWYDLSPYGNKGTLQNGPTYNSANGGSLIFDGSNDYCTAGNSTRLAPTNVTVSAWVKPSSFTNQGNIVSKSSNLGYRMRFQSNGAFWMYANGNTITSPSTYSINNWYHTVGVFSTTGLRMYVNGSLVQSNGTAFAPSYLIFNFYVGAFSTTQELFQGNIGYVGVYDRALDQTEITQNFNAQRTRFGI
jgi:hypothetical protein